MPPADQTARREAPETATQRFQTRVFHAVVLLAESNAQESFAWNDRTMFMQGDKKMSATDLKKGTNLTVSYKK